ncbi:hypothetical protein F4780DRAFT_483193 [Xylariomycetidae sp. FL0641]|nr:hypothetical protein F4780DRAFT_483193 [Xylariomycetidae sp. FL0641]
MRVPWKPHPNRASRNATEAEVAGVPAEPSMDRGSDNTITQEGARKESMRKRLKIWSGSVAGNISDSVSGTVRRRMVNHATYTPKDTEPDGEVSDTWPALRKSFSSMASSVRGLRSDRPSMDSQTSRVSTGTLRSALSSPGSSRAKAKPGADRRRVTIQCPGSPTSSPPTSPPTSPVRRVSIGAIAVSELSPRLDPLPQLPGLDEMLTYISCDGPSAIEYDSSETSTIRGEQPRRVNPLLENLQQEHGAMKGFPPTTRLPIRLKRPEAAAATNPKPMLAVHGTGMTLHSQRSDSGTFVPPHDEQSFKTSRVPVQWLDRILETSISTRAPIPSCLHPDNRRGCGRKVRMQTRKVRVLCPQENDQPPPPRTYYTLNAALEDFREVFSEYYAPFATYDYLERTVQLYKLGSECPERQFLDCHTVTLDLREAFDEWVKAAMEVALAGTLDSEIYSDTVDERSTAHSDQTDEIQTPHFTPMRSNESLQQDLDDMDMASRLA